MRGLPTGVVVAAAMTLAAPATLAQTSDQVLDANPASKAADTQQQLNSRSTLTGDWGGLRTRLSDGGVDLTAGYTSEAAANVSGGDHHDAAETGQFAFGATVDMDKLVGLRGGTFQATITLRRGHDLDQTAGLGTLQQVQEVYGRGQTWRLTEFWYQQQFGNGIDLKAGRLTMSSDFGAFSCDFENLTFCGTPAGNIVGSYWYNSPVSQWGGRVRLKHTNWYLMAGVYESNPNNIRNNFTISHGGAAGVTAPVEFGWTPKLGPNHLPGSYKIGAWYNSDNSSDVLVGADRRPFIVTGLEPLQHTGRFGANVLIQQQLTGRSVDDPKAGPTPTHGLSVFFNITQTDRQTSTTDNQIAAGLFYVGAVPGRPEDDIGLAVGRTNVNGRAAFADVLRAPGTEKPDAEYASELYYSIHLRPWLILRPNVQYIVNPGGFHEATDVVVLGAKTAITF